MRWRKFKVLFMRASIRMQERAEEKKVTAQGVMWRRSYSVNVSQCNAPIDYRSMLPHTMISLHYSCLVVTESEVAHAGQQLVSNFLCPSPFKVSQSSLRPLGARRQVALWRFLRSVVGRHGELRVSLRRRAGHSEPLILHYCRCCRCAGDKIKCSRNDI